MKYLHLIFTIVIFTGAIAQNEEPLLKVEGFSHPESVVFDEQNNVLYVSNMADDKDGDGFISKITPEGEILDLKWITGLNDPKGLLVHEDKLYVTDVTELVEMDLQKGEINRKIPVDGAMSLNDITVDAGGSIFFSDLEQSSIYFIPGEMAANSMRVDTPKGEIAEFLKSSKLNSPNGLLAHKDDLYAASWGENQDGNLLKIDMDTKEIFMVTEEGIGNLDGIQPSGKDFFYVSDWATGKIYSIDPNGNKTLVLTAEKSSGDILFLKEKNQLILPMNFQNSVWWYQLD
ncbi:ATP-binding protein [Salinimicrobium marinum]|uniref:ATP-binding protein n=1 Tax=Salinimicrobium marinum TaxID=680283 RepID=A0A918SA34_9FLAO|nr:SMP-30/gluconolactonase/LRE family protein [Salinimicrobium marinum]GHA31209.1 ATP-binding protein [Salinimicrobium marinum]